VSKQLREGHDVRLTGRVRHTLRQRIRRKRAAEGKERRDVDDGARSALDHRRQRRPRQARHREHVNADQIGGDVRVELDERPVAGEARVVDEHVDAGRPRFHLRQAAGVVRSAATTSARVGRRAASSSNRSRLRATRTTS